MPADRHLTTRRVAELSVLALILAAAAAARLWSLGAGIPHAVGIDEPQIVDRALRILRTGDWNPHIFDYPTLVIYLHAMVAIVRFMWGALRGEWGSLDGFSIAAVYTAGRFVAAMIGVATVWLTYRLGTELSSRRVALLAAAQMAVHPLHVRESHFILTDVPMTALTTLAVWLSVRAARLRTVQAYGWAGAACGLAAAAKYNGGIAIVAPIVAWVIHDVKHLSPPGGRWSVPLAICGIAVLVWRSSARTRWMPVILFTLAYFYILSTHSHVFGRYALPLVPMLCLFTSVAVLEAIRFLARFRPLARPGVQRLLIAAAVILLVYGPTVTSVRWLNQQKRSDTRAMATDWLKANTPRGTRVAVENNGPTYLETEGFRVTGTELLLDKSADWYRERADYLVISAADLTRYGEYVSAGPTVFQIGPTPQRWGPPVLIVKLAR